MTKLDRPVTVLHELNRRTTSAKKMLDELIDDVDRITHTDVARGLADGLSDVAKDILNDARTSVRSYKQRVIRRAWQYIKDHA